MFVHWVTLYNKTLPVLNLAQLDVYRVCLFANSCVHHMHIHKYTLCAAFKGS